MYVKKRPGWADACLDAGRKPCLHSELMVVSIPSW